MSSDANVLMVPVPHGTLAVVDEGDGPPVVLVHAGICDLRSWDAMTPALVAGGLRVIRYDARGHGGSTTEDVEFSTIDDLVAVLDARGVHQALLVGNSRGGYVSIETALDHPERVVGVVGVGSGVAGFDPPLTAEEDALVAEMDRLEEAETPDVEAIAELDVRFWVDGPGQQTDRVDPAVRDYVRDVDRALYAPGHVRGRSVRPATDAVDRLSGLAMPIVMVAGALDVSESVTIARHVASIAPRGRAVVWDDVAHMIGMEQPQRLAEVVLGLAAEIGVWQ
jgi:pimeloyl-ACP methyl ester carboxylesterase